MKKKVPKGRLSSKKKVVAKKSYYKPKKKVVKKVAKKKVTKKKSYYKPKKKAAIEIAPAAIAPVVKEVNTPPALSPADVVQEKIDNPTKSKRPVKYLNNRDLLAQVLLSKKKGEMNNELAKMLMLLTSRYGKKGNFANYTYNDDMQSYAMLMLCKTWKGFDPAKSSNAFAWYTQCIKNSFIQYLKYEKRQRDAVDGMLVKNGLSPSFGYQYDYENQGSGEAHEEPEVIEAPTKATVDGFSSLPDDPADQDGSTLDTN